MGRALHHAAQTFVASSDWVAVRCKWQGKEWLQTAMLQSTENGALAFLHQTTSGAKQGRASEDNPLRRWWPEFITAPITGHIGPQIIGWHHEKAMVALDKISFHSATFRCKAASEGRSHGRAMFSSSRPRRLLSKELPFLPQGDYTRRNLSISLVPLPKGAETICPWDGSLSILKADFTAENGMHFAVDTLNAYQDAFDRVLRHISIQIL